jgi:hypothetical protein
MVPPTIADRPGYVEAMTSGSEHGDDTGRTAVTWPGRCRLPELDLDPTPLAAEALALPAAAWEPHFHRAIYTGDWSGVALRSVGGDPSRLYPAGPGLDPDRSWQPTPWLASCPATAAVLEALPFPITSVRMLRLGPGSEIRSHNDPGLGAAHGEVRLHLALVSGDGVSFGLAGEPVDLRPGEWWYLDLDQHHTAANRGATPRIHLVVDGLVDDRLASRLTTGAPALA